MLQKVSNTDGIISKVKDKYDDNTKIIEKGKEYQEKAKLVEENKGKLDNFIKKESRKLRKEKASMAEEADKLSFEYKGARITVRQNDLVKEYVDAIVNPANENLNHAGGAARAIADAAGYGFEQDCDTYIDENETLPTGCSMITRAGGTLNCDHVIHTVGPRYNKNQKNHAVDHEQLKNCFQSILNIMKHKGLYDVSIPAISTGIFGFPLRKCVEICGKTIKNAIDQDAQAFAGKEIILCNFDDKTTTAFEEKLQEII